MPERSPPKTTAAEGGELVLEACAFF